MTNHRRPPPAFICTGVREGGGCQHAPRTIILDSNRHEPDSGASHGFIVESPRLHGGTSIWPAYAAIKGLIIHDPGALRDRGGFCKDRPSHASESEQIWAMPDDADAQQYVAA